MEGLLLFCVLRVSARGTQQQRCPLPLLTSCPLSSCLKKWHSTRKPTETFPKAGAQSRHEEGVAQEVGQLKR